MKKILPGYLLIVLLVLPIISAQAQKKSEPYFIGTSSEVVSKFKSNSDRKAGVASPSKEVSINVEANKSLTLMVTSGKHLSNGETFVGKVKGENSMFHLKSIENKIEGNIILKDKNKAYKVFSDNKKLTYVQEVSVDEVICTEFYKINSSTSQASISGIPSNISISNLESYPAATAVALLDFDGQLVENGNWNFNGPIHAQPALLTDEEKYEIWHMVSEDFRPYKLNITTNESVYQNAPKNRRMRVILTPTDDAGKGWGGVAFIGSFNWGDDTPCWVFNNGIKGAGEATSHELGHTLGLFHDGFYNDGYGYEYYSGHGSWCPIMGTGYSVETVQWSKGEYFGANNMQDDVEVIAEDIYGIGFRDDAHGDNHSSASSLLIDPFGNIPPNVNWGVIEKSTDIDVFSFTTTGGAVSLSINAAELHPNLDILATLRNSSGSIIATSNPEGHSASFNLNLAAGTYFLHVDGTGAGNPLIDGYTDYGSIGYYSISGNLLGSKNGNLALNKPVTASSTESTTTPASNVVDGINTTRWASIFADPQWIYVDLQAIYKINRVKIVWEAAYASNYKVQFSSDAVNWSDIKNVVGNSTVINDWSGLSGSGRYVRIYGTARGSSWGYSIYELEVYGSTGNVAPLISINSPGNNSSFPGSSSITVTASAYDTDGSVNKVEFYNGNNKVGEDLTAPYSFVLNNLPVGLHTIRAVAIDNDGASASATITVRINNLPTVKITAPMTAINIVKGSQFAINAEAADSDGTIAKVEFFWNGSKIGEDLTSPYSMTWLSNEIGAHQLTAKATDNFGATTTSETIYIYIVGYPPVVKIISPANNSTFPAYSNITVRAEASDPDGVVHSVSFYRGRYASFTDYTAPFEYVIEKAEPGFYSMFVDAYDNEGNRGVSEWIYFTVTGQNLPPTVSIASPVNGASYTSPASVLINANATDSDGTVSKVEFYNGATKLGEDLISPYSFTWTNVTVGSYAITAVATDNAGSTTTSSVVNITVNNPGEVNLAINKPVSTSTAESASTSGNFAVDGNLSTRWASLFADPQWIYVDLQSTYTINRVKISWEAAYGKDFKVQLSNDGSAWTDLKSITGNTALVNDITGLSGNGRYVRIYGTARATSWGYSIYELEVYGASSKNQSPVVSITSPANNSTFASPTNISITANASDLDGTISKVEFYRGTTLLGTATTAPYIYNWTNVAAGTYSLTAKAFDNFGASTVSTAVTVTVTSNTNLALNKPVTVSSTEVNTTIGSYAVDGNSTTRWSSIFADPQWIYVDLLSNYNINRVKINWEGAYGRDYKIQVSSNASTWTDIKTVTGNTTLVNDLTGLTGTGRYLRILGTARGTVYGYSIFEIEVYGSAASSLAKFGAEEMEESNVHVFPVPAKENFNVVFYSQKDIESLISLTLVDEFDKRYSTIKKEVGADAVQFDIKSLTTGVYFLKISNGTNSEVKRVIIN